LLRRLGRRLTATDTAVENEVELAAAVMSRLFCFKSLLIYKPRSNTLLFYHTQYSALTRNFKQLVEQEIGETLASSTFVRSGAG